MFQTLGLEYAKHQEIAYGLPLAILIVVACAIYKVHEAGGSIAGYVVVGVITFITLVQVPGAIQQAKSECRTQLSKTFPDDLDKAQQCREQFPDLDRENRGPLDPPPFPLNRTAPGAMAKAKQRRGRRSGPLRPLTDLVSFGRPGRPRSVGDA